ncbi:MAG: glutamate-5-semialdehyde dehydrogenase [Chloroflexi bacterium RBG_16_57_11]|nr:MAG: glutamate-5-semialdehyde dehydrogenase [Chloroflexi bacterium RBG_16_57_11]
MLVTMGKQARSAAKALSRASTGQKNAALLSLADRLISSSDAILAANRQDVAEAETNGLSAAMIDRLTLNIPRLEGIAEDLRKVIELPDPVGEIFEPLTLPNGLRVHKQRVPLGVLAVIYEARPNVTLDVAGLALKTGNAVILRGGSETLRTNRELVAVIRGVLQECGLPEDAVQFIDDPDRARVMELLQMYEYIDMLIPRGGAALHQFCRENSRIPVITGGIGICHLFVDQSADFEAAVKVIYNAKTQRPTVCNALDTVLVHRSVAADILPQVVARLEEAGVSFRADESAMPYLIPDHLGGTLPASVTTAGPEDFDTEWLSLVLGLKVVDGIDQAIEHIAAHSTQHSDGILTHDDANARRFIAEVDSSAVYVNASTRFTDGSQLGLGAEVAISTQRLHARGPMALRELTTYKWVVQGDYTVRQ